MLVYDYLASPALSESMPLRRADLRREKRWRPHPSQDKINALIVEKARQGKIVTRLKGGDPFIFGRGGEEAEELIEAGIPYEVVPGVTSAIAAPAYAGIPFTHRDFTSTVAFITGHEDPPKTESESIGGHWPRESEPWCFSWGSKIYPRSSKINGPRHGPRNTGAVVRWGTCTTEQVTGTLETIVETG